MKDTCNASLLRQLPQVEEVLHESALTNLKGVSRTIVVNAVRNEIEKRRKAILDGDEADTGAASIAQAAAARTRALTTPSLKRIINATGVIIHTNLGRSALAPEAIEAVKDVIVGYSSLEYDTQHMARGSRHDHCEPLICALTGAEAAIAVNNNAAAVMMVLSVFAAGHETVVSRGEQVEIGGSFRIPDIMQQSGTHMVEVGMTNKTYLRDYEEALTDDTVMLFKAHPSNYLMTGFAELVSISELRSLADAHEAKTGNHVLIYEDQGSGAFLELSAFGNSAEPTVAQSLAAGADLVSFSGDKLLGGPQAGIIAGRADLIARLKASPLARVLRLDKMTLAALEATLRIYLDPDQALQRIPTVRMLVEDPECVRKRACALHDAIQTRIGSGKATLEVIPEISRAGGGALPMRDIGTHALQMRFIVGNAQDCWQFLAQSCPVSIVARIHEESVLFDARTILSKEEINVISLGVALYFDQLATSEGL
ncbi:MAG: L-seryl-tRNA(Sec) selenium transferase [Eggerthellaceae bacterium]|nr:L-seryl-tRNA(Sec) selenium transferase [Eggerthellaceae bacterium]